MSHTISVVIPAHNAGKYIRETIMSVTSQTYLPKEIIVADDGSTDETSIVVQNMPPLGVSLNYIRKEKGGAGSARNEGIKASSGDYIAFLDADDLWERNKLEKQIAVFEKSEFQNLGAVYCNYSVIDTDGSLMMDMSFFDLDPTIRGRVYEKQLYGNFIAGSASGVIAKKQCFETVGLFDEHLPGSEDWEMWIRIAEKFDFDFCSEKLVRLRRHMRNVSNDDPFMLIGKILTLNKLALKNHIPPIIAQQTIDDIAVKTAISYQNGTPIDYTRHMNEQLKQFLWTIVESQVRHW